MALPYQLVLTRLKRFQPDRIKNFFFVPKELHGKADHNYAGWYDFSTMSDKRCLESLWQGSHRFGAELNGRSYHDHQHTIRRSAMHVRASACSFRRLETPSFGQTSWLIHNRKATPTFNMRETRQHGSGLTKNAIRNHCVNMALWSTSSFIGNRSLINTVAPKLSQNRAENFKKTIKRT